MINNLKSLLGIEDNSLDDKLNLILDLTTQRLKALLGGTEVPEHLDYIIIEVSIIRFNRIGPEGLSSHEVEGETLKFTDDDFAGYKADINRYLEQINSSEQRGGFKFL